MSQAGWDSESMSRRQFLIASGGATFGAASLANFVGASGTAEKVRLGANGRGAKYVPRIEAAFVRRKGDDDNAALREFRGKFKSQVTEPGVKVCLRPEPVYSIKEAAGWVSQAKAEKADGLFVVIRDRQGHAWATALMAADSKIPTAVFTAAGPGPTSNAINIGKISGVHICPTREFREAAFGLKMLKTGAKLREMRFVILSGNKRRDEEVARLGTKVRYLPAKAFVEEYMGTSSTNEVKGIATEYIRNARKTSGVSEEKLFSSVKSYIVARRILERQEADGIAMDCHGVFLRTQVNRPCIAWSRMLDHAIPAACKAEIGACLTQALVQYLFDRPGFQIVPVADIGRRCLIGAHCTCPTRLNGFSKPPEPFDLGPHHGNRDAVLRPLWSLGQRVTVARLGPAEQLIAKGEPPGTPPRLYVAAGTVVENASVRPGGRSAASVTLRLDGERDLHAYPDFQQLFFYGDYKRDLLEYCKLFRIQVAAV